MSPSAAYVAARGVRRASETITPVIFWFAGVSFVAVWVAFRSPALDYRLVMLGATAPLLDAVTGGAWVLHTLVASVAVLVLVMLLLRRRRLRQRQWLGVPIGMFLHLVLDGAWTRTEVFWWPFLGTGFGDAFPETARPAGLIVVMELAGLAALGWSWVRFGLGEPARRRRFLGTGQLDRALVRGEGSG